MLHRLRTVVIVMLAAVLGAVLGRVILQARERMDAGEPPTDVDIQQVAPRVQDVIPGLVAAFRVKDAPWSWFRIPAWFAAFAVNLGVGAAGGDIAALKARAERMAFDAVGLDARDFGMGGDVDEPGGTAAASDEAPRTAAWGAPPPPPPPPTSL